MHIYIYIYIYNSCLISFRGSCCLLLLSSSVRRGEGERGGARWGLGSELLMYSLNAGIGTVRFVVWNSTKELFNLIYICILLQVYSILDEVFLAGEIEETSKNVVLTRLDHLDKLE